MASAPSGGLETPTAQGANPRGAGGSTRRMADIRRAAEVAQQLGAHSCETRGVKIVFRLPTRSDQAGKPARTKESSPQPSAKQLKERQRSRARMDKFHADIRAGTRTPKSLQPTSGSLSPPLPLGTQVEDGSGPSAASFTAKQGDRPKVGETR